MKYNLNFMFNLLENVLKTTMLMKFSNIFRPLSGKLQRFLIMYFKNIYKQSLMHV